MKRRKKNFTKRMMAAFISMCVVFGSINLTAFAADPDTANYTTVADASTAQNYESMLGTDVDGNRYAGRVWADKSVYTDSSVSLDGNSVTNDDDFMVVYSAIGSSTSVSTETVTGGDLDVVLILDVSASMGRYVDNNKTTRLASVVASANGLINNILSSDDNQIAVVTYGIQAQTLLGLDHYDLASGSSNILSVSQASYPNAQADGGVKVEAGDATITARGVTTSGTVSNTRDCYYQGTNLQSGIAMGMDILASQTGTVTGRTPVVIVLTDGVADYAVRQNWWSYNQNNAVHPASNEITGGVALSTLLNASYMKSAVNKVYDRDAVVYGVSVDLDDDSDAYVVMNPAEVFKAGSSNSVVSTAWTNYQSWANGTGTVTLRENNTSWTFAQLGTNTYNVTKDEVISNINYVDTHYSVGSAELSSIFDEIYAEITTPAFNPITDTVVSGGYDVAVPFTYVDFIGEYMEVKEFKQVTLFGKTYSIAASTTVAPYVYDNVNADGTLTRTTTTTYHVGVGAEKITHPVFKTEVSVEDCVTIELIDECVGYLDPSNNFVKTGVSLQTVWVYITEDALPILLSEVDVNVTDGVTTTLYTETDEDPIRLYYTVGISNDVKDAGTDHVNLSLVDAEYVEKNTVTLLSGEKRVQFYSNRYGNMNTVDANGDLNGDAHVSFTASEQNRYYYHQNNYPIFSALTDLATGTTPVIDESEWGILYHEHDHTQAYELTWMTYQEAVATQTDGDTTVYTVVGFYRPDDSTADTTDGDDVAYMAYSSWQELRLSTVFAYVTDADGVGTDDPSQSTAVPIYLNWENGQIVESSVAGYAVSEDETEHAAYIAAVAAYVNAKEGWDLGHVYAYLAIGSKRVTRLHNMTVDKAVNTTGTANVAYAPTYNEDTTHVGGIVIWLGNNGLLSVTPDVPPTSLQISKTTTDANADAVFTFTITDTTNAALAGTYEAVLTDASGEAETSVTFSAGTATVQLKHGQNILIEELPIGDTLTVAETGRGKYDLQSVIVNGEALTAGAETAEVTLVAGHTTTVDFVNEPKAYGSLSIVKEITHNLGDNYTIPADLTFTVQVDLGAGAANETFTYVKAAVTDTVTADGNGVLKFELQNGQEVVIYNLEAGTVAKVTEPAPGTGFAATYWLNGTEVTGTEAAATIAANTTQVVVVENTYDPNYTEISPSILVSGTKTVTPENAWTDEVFTIILEKLVNGVWTPMATQTVTKNSPTFNGTVNGAINKALNEEKYSAPGIYSYRVREANYGQTIEGWTYDATLHTFDIVVVDSGMNGTLEVANVICTHTGENHFAKTGNIWANDDLDFTNTYDAEGTSVTLHIEKAIDNVAKSSLASVEGYHFGLYDSTGTLKYESELTDASGEALIQILYPYNGALTYPVQEVYTLKEIIPEETAKKAGVTYDDTEYTVTITLTLEGGKVHADYTIVEKTNETNTSAGTETDPVNFTNTYAPTGTWQFAANKVLTGRNTALAENEFEFQMDLVYYRESAATQPVAMTTDTPLVAKNAAGGTITFDTITFTQVGYYFYEVTEVVGTKGGITYDTTKHTVRVTVTDNNGTLVANAIVLDNADNAITFTNTYAPAPVQVELRATKALTGRSNALMDREFVFGLVDANADGTRVANAVPVYASNTAGGEVVFTKTYEEAGEYYYRMRETSTDGFGITTDGARYVYRVVVTDDNEGNLSYQISFREENTAEWTPVSGTTTGAAFVNTYKASGSVTILGMKQLIGKDLEAEQFSFGLHEATVGAQGIEVGALVASAVNGADGLFSFTIPYEDFTFDVGETSKTYTYIAHEKQEVVYDDITYDETQYLVEVTVTDNGDGTLTAVPKITVEGGTEEYAGVEFYNVYNTSEIEENLPKLSAVKKQRVGDGEATTEKQTVSAGDKVTYEITVTNSGNERAVNVEITDALPEGLIVVEDSISHDGVLEDGTVVWMLEVLEAGESVTVSVTVTVPNVDEDTEWKNVATVAYGNDTDDEDETTNEVVVEEKVQKAPKMGDDTSLAMWSTLAFASLMACGAILVIEKKKRGDI